MWSLGKVLQTPEVVRVYIGSFWDKPYQNEDNRKLFEAEQNDLLRDLYNLPKYAAVRKINELVKRARMAKVHAYIIGHLKNEMPSMFGKNKRQEELIEGLRNEFIKVHQRHNLPVGDFPDITRFREVLKASDFNKFQKLNPKLIESMDQVLAEDIPRLMQQFPQERDKAANTAFNPFENTSPFDPNSPFDDGPIPREDRVKAAEVFGTLGPADGKITGKAASSVLVQSKLPRDILSKVWVLADRDKDGHLTEEEFAIALWLVRIAVEGKPLPYALPPSLQLPNQQGSTPQQLPPQYQQSSTPQQQPSYTQATYIPPQNPSYAQTQPLYPPSTPYAAPEYGNQEGSLY